MSSSADLINLEINRSTTGDFFRREKAAIQHDAWKMMSYVTASSSIHIGPMPFNSISSCGFLLGSRGMHGNGEDWDPMVPMGFPWEWE